MELRRKSCRSYGAYNDFPKFFATDMSLRWSYNYFSLLPAPCTLYRSDGAGNDPAILNATNL